MKIIFVLLLVVYVTSQLVQITEDGQQIPKNQTIVRQKYTSLGYITDWNSDGYQVAVKNLDKLTHLAPAWYTINFYKGIGFVVVGGTEEPWYKQLPREKVKVLPRFGFSLLNQESFEGLLDRIFLEKLGKDLLMYIEKNNFDGLVLELGYIQMSMIKGEILFLMQVMREELKSKGKEIILVIPAPRQQQILFTKQDLEDFTQYIDYFSMMTYDFTTPGPISPYKWNEYCLDYYKSKKVLLGINFYGYEHDKPILGKDFKKVLETEKGQVQWNEDFKEQLLTRIDGRVIYYPSKESIRVRTELAIKYETGIAIWELGQGLEEFFEVL